MADTATSTTISTKTPVFDVNTFTKNTSIEKDTEFVDEDGNMPFYKVTGEAAFDKMMEMVHKHLTALLMSNCIRREDFAKLYCSLLADTMQIAVVAEEKATNNALTKRQLQGFNETFKTNMFKIMCDSWAVGFSASEDAFYDETVASKALPTPLTGPEITTIYNTYIKPEFDEAVSYTKEQTMATDDDTSSS